MGRMRIASRSTTTGAIAKKSRSRAARARGATSTPAGRSAFTTTPTVPTEMAATKNPRDGRAASIARPRLA